LVTVLCRFFRETAFSREYGACKECAWFFAPPVQNVPGFVVPETIPSRFGDYWGHNEQAREARVCVHIM